MSVCVTVVVCDGHVVKPIVLRGRRARGREAVGLVGDSIGRAEALGGAYGAGPLAGVKLGVHAAVAVKAILFGSGWRGRWEGARDSGKERKRERY